jgi:hypothetical protein
MLREGGAYNDLARRSERAFARSSAALEAYLELISGNAFRTMRGGTSGAIAGGVPSASALSILADVSRRTWPSVQLNIMAEP